MTGLDSHRAQEAPARPKSPDYRQTRPPHERTLLLDHRKTSRQERSIKEERRLARPEEELRAEDRATKTSVSSMFSAMISGLRGTILTTSATTSNFTTRAERGARGQSAGQLVN
uniref:Uncharacterized protein n=2 Tax=Oryza TaxID=4527 RepID=A0A0E0H3A3_ORYNI